MCKVKFSPGHSLLADFPELLRTTSLPCGGSGSGFAGGGDSVAHVGIGFFFPSPGLDPPVSLRRVERVYLSSPPGDQTLISTSTPEGSSSFISASIVLGVDE